MTSPTPRLTVRAHYASGGERELCARADPAQARDLMRAALVYDPAVRFDVTTTAKRRAPNVWL